MKIGILKEPEFDKRVSLLPDNVKKLTEKNISVLVEEGAGKEVFAGDDSYTNAGAETGTNTDITDQADMLLRINPLSKKEMKPLKEGQIVVSLFNPLVNTELVEEASNRGITTLSLDHIPRTTRAQSMDVLSSMATVAGYRAVLDAATHLPSFFPMFMTAAGTIKPAKVLVLGAGVAGLQAIATARKLGGVVEAFDVRSAVKEEVESIGAKFIEVGESREEGDSGGYAVEQSEEYKQKQQQLIQDHARKSDVIISTAQIPGKKAPVLITKDTVENMRPGSVIVDLAASSGGNCELTQNSNVIREHEVSIIGRSDYPSDMQVDASQMYGNNLMNFLNILTTEDGQLNLNFEDDIITATCITHNGAIVNEKVKNTKNT